MTTNKQLRELASKATAGPWWIDSHGHRMSANGGLDTVFVAESRMGPATRHPETGNLSHWPNDWDASYIAAANPDRVLELLDEVEVLQDKCLSLEAELAESRANDRQAMAYLEAVREIVGGDSFPEMIGRVKELQIERNGCKLALKEWLEKSERVEESRE